MFMDNRALLDQLMGKDRNAPTFKGISEQWKDPSMCKAYILDFCPYELFYNTKVFLGNCRGTHSDVVKHQFDTSSDKDKASLRKKYELDLLTQLERIIDSVDLRVRKQQERVQSKIADYRLPAEKQRELDEMNQEISISMKQVERLAEQGIFEESALLMSKVEELTRRAAEFKKQAENRYFKTESVCSVCGAVTVFSLDEHGKEELINDHLRGRQHSGMERVRMKVIELKNRHSLHLSRRDREFEPSESIQHELKREGIEVILPDKQLERSPRNNRSPRRRSRSPRRRESPRRRARSPSTPRSMVSVTFE
jgi:hypothetical protein